MSKEYTLTRAQVAKIHKIACNGWKTKIEGWVAEKPFSDTIPFSEQRVKEMFGAAEPSQKSVLETLFPEYEPGVTKIKSMNDVEKILGEDFIGGNIRVNTTMDKESKAIKATKATLELINIAAAYNKMRDVTLDWKNTSQSKYFSYYDFSDGGLGCHGWGYAADYPAGVAFASLEDLKDAQKKFKQVFLDFHMV